MRQAPFFRFDGVLSNARAINAGVDYLRKDASKLSLDDCDRATVIDGIGAIAVVLAAATSRWSGPVTCTVSSGEEFADRQNAAYDLVEEMTVMANAHLQPLLAKGPQFQLPKRSSGGGGGAMSLSHRDDPAEAALKDATPRVIAGMPLVEFVLSAINGQFFPADKPSGKFFAYLFANKPAAAQDVESVINSAFHASQK